MKLLVLFGSQATGKTNAKSDADIAILDDHKLSFEERCDIARSMARRLKISEERIDIVDLWTAPPLLQYQIARHGKLLEGDAFDFLRFKVLAWKRYQDTAKFRRARDKKLEYLYGQRSY